MRSGVYCGGEGGEIAAREPLAVDPDCEIAEEAWGLGVKELVLVFKSRGGMGEAEKREGVETYRDCEYSLRFQFHRSRRRC